MRDPALRQDTKRKKMVTSRWLVNSPLLTAQTKRHSQAAEMAEWVEVLVSSLMTQVCLIPGTHIEEGGLSASYHTRVCVNKVTRA